MDASEKKMHYIRCYEYLLWIRVAVILISLLSRIPLIGGYVALVRFLPSLAMIAVLWKLADGKDRYRKAMILLAVSFGIEVVTHLVGSLTNDSQMVTAAAVINLAASLFSFLAVYQEYNAHAERIEPLDPALSRKWRGLFNWQIVFWIGSWLMFGALSVLMLVMPAITEIYAWVVEVVQLIINWCYINNLLAMCRRLKNAE